MAVSFTRCIKGVFALCLTITICSLAIRIYIYHAPVLNVQTRFNLPAPGSSPSTGKPNFLQKLLHDALRLPLPAGAGSSVEAPPGPLSENMTLAKIESFARSQPLNSSLGQPLYAQIKERVDGRGERWQTHEKQFVRDGQFLNYLTCPSTLRKKILQHKLSSDKFLPEVPLLLYHDHFNDEEFKRLSKFQGINGWNEMEETEVAGAVRSLKSPSNKYLFDDRLVHGTVPRRSGCVRCAVIGNGGIMNGSKKGKEIDAHDYVFRVNVALTKGFEEDLGVKTSFYCFTMVTLNNSLRGGTQFGFREPPYSKGIRYVFFADSDWTYSYLNAILHKRPAPHSSGKYKRSPPKFKKDLEAEDIKVLHPDFQRYIKWSWVNSTAQHKSVHRPTTGAIMLLLALHTCDEVNVYGFGGSYTKYSEHYYDKSFQRHVFYANHDNNAENALWQRLDELGIINVYTRD